MSSEKPTYEALQRRSENIGRRLTQALAGEKASFAAGRYSESHYWSTQVCVLQTRLKEIKARAALLQDWKACPQGIES